MDANNETCIQRARFIFDFFEKNNWQAKEEPPLNKIVKSKNVQPGAVRELNKFLTKRLDNIAAMMEVLLKVHDDWAITGKKDQIIMETETFDFNDAIQVLKEHGFSDEEYILKVEYSRKWGIL